MGALVSIWLQFAACVALIGVAGPELSRSSDVIAEKTGLSRGWIGIVLLASATSLPELVVGISAVTVAGTPDVAIGDAFGSCVFNLVILVVLDFFQRGESVYRRARQGHVLSGGFGVVLIGYAGISLLLQDRGLGLGIAIGHVGIYTPVILLLYLLAMRTVFRYERAHRGDFAEEIVEHYREITLRRAVLRYAAAAAVTFLPELVVTLSAFRLGALDMAISNLFGSNFSMWRSSLSTIFFSSRGRSSPMSLRFTPFPRCLP